MRHKVLIMRCDSYDPDRISGIIRDGIQELGVKPRGRIMLKPNTVIAHPKVFPHAFTRSEFLDGALQSVIDGSENGSSITVGERSGITVPTRFCFRNAGYMKVLKKRRIRPVYFDEHVHIPFRLKGKDRLRDEILVPKPVAETDFLINLPKFKAHPWTGITLSLKNFIGLQDDRHRLVDHNSLLDHKIVDLQEIIPSRFIVVDAITAGQKMMLTPTPFDMGAIIMGTNPCAVDTVGCRMIHVDPNRIHHLRMASERGVGPVDPDEIDIGGDFPLEEVRAKTVNFETFLERIDDHYRDSLNLSCIAGEFPEKHSKDYCWGGCPGALQEAMHIFEGYHPGVTEKMKKVRYIAGKYEGDITLEKGERALFAGDCTSWKGRLNGKQVEIKSGYKTREKVDVRQTRTNDMLYKIISSLLYSFRRRKSDYFHAKGCPVSVGEHVNYISALGKIPNVNFDSSHIVHINFTYWQMRVMRFINRLRGK